MSLVQLTRVSQCVTSNAAQQSTGTVWSYQILTANFNIQFNGTFMTIIPQWDITLNPFPAKD